MEDNSEIKMQQVNPRLNSVTGGFAYSALAVIYCLFSIIISIIISAVVKGAMGSYGFTDYNEAFEAVTKSDGYLYASYLSSPLIICVCTLFILKMRKISFRRILPVKCKPKYFLISLLLIFGLLFSLSWTNEVSVEFFKLFGYKPREATSYFPELSGGYIVPALLVIAVMPAFFEELMFRGVLLNCCERDMGGIRAILVTGFCFSLYHTSPEQTVYQFIAGCAFAFLAVRSGSILPSMLMHLINNALIVILQACGQFDAAGNIMMSQAANITLIVLSAVSLVGAAVWLVLDKKPFTKCVNGSVKSFFKYASVGVAILGLLWILSLFGLS